MTIDNETMLRVRERALQLALDYPGAGSVVGVVESLEDRVERFVRIITGAAQPNAAA